MATPGNEIDEDVGQTRTLQEIDEKAEQTEGAGLGMNGPAGSRHRPTDCGGDGSDELGMAHSREPPPIPPTLLQAEASRVFEIAIDTQRAFIEEPRP